MRTQKPTEKEKEMKDIINKMDLMEHCPGCGALLTEEVIESICGNCGFTPSEVEELMQGSMKKSRKRRKRRKDRSRITAEAVQGVIV